MTRTGFSSKRRTSLGALLALLAGGCGGGGSSANDAPAEGSVQTPTLFSRSNGTTYPLTIYVPPVSEAKRATLPVVYLLDGEARFNALFAIVATQRLEVIIVAIGFDAMRNRDYVPPNSCTSGGGGQAAYLDFIRLDLSPFVESSIGGDPKRRILLGHSHGGSFVLYAAFAQPATAHHFSAYLASDASIDCMSATVYGWEAGYAAANPALPVRLHIAYSANTANAAFATQVQGRRYAGLVLAAQLYSGGHIGMIPAAFSEALAFALA